MVSDPKVVRRGLPTAVGEESSASGPSRGESVAELREEYVRVKRDDLDFAIAQVSNALRALLELGLSDCELNNRRSNSMVTEASRINANERYDVFVVENYEDSAGEEKSNWSRVGVAFPHKDGDGLNLELRAIPVSGKLVIRRHVAKSRGDG